MWIAGWVVEEKYCSFPASWSFRHAEIFGKLYVGEGGLLWNCELMYFYIPLYFTEKLLPFLVPRVSIFYATPTPPSLLILRSKRDADWFKLKWGSPHPPCWLIVLLTLHAKTGSTRKKKEAGGGGSFVHDWLPSSSHLFNYYYYFCKKNILIMSVK